MEEAITEEAQEASPAEAHLEERIEDSTESRLDGKSYQSRGGEGRYAKAVEYKKREVKENLKDSSSKKVGLEKLIETLKKEARTLGVDETEYISSQLTKYPLKYVGNVAHEVPDSLDGGHAIIAYLHPETGELHLSFEKKPLNYPIAKYAGTLSLYGGSLKIGEPANEGLVREVMEEDKDSYRIIIKALNETRWKVAEINAYIDGVPSTTHIWLAYIRDPTEVRNYLSSKTAEGDKTSLSLEKVLKAKDSDFTFDFGPIVKEVASILRENRPKIYSYTLYNSNSKNMLSSIPFYNLN